MLTVPKASTVQYNSDSALNMATDKTLDDNYFNTKRQKRSFDELLDKPLTSVSLVSDIKSMFSEIKQQQDDKLEAISNTLLTIMSQNLDIQKSVEVMSNKHEQLLSKISDLETENKEYKHQMSIMESKIEILEKNAHCTSLEIRNLPKQKEENKGFLIDIVKNLVSTLDTDNPIQQTEIKDIYRPNPRTLIINFTTAIRKESLLTGYKTYNKQKRANKEPLLHSQHIGLDGTPSPIYLSERLTSKARRLFYVARENVRNNKLVASWTSYGKVFIKINEDSNPIPINDERDLQKLVL